MKILEELNAAHEGAMKFRGSRKHRDLFKRFYNKKCWMPVSSIVDINR
jgi:hypothetical protein